MKSDEADVFWKCLSGGREKLRGAWPRLGAGGWPVSGDPTKALPTREL